MGTRMPSRFHRVARILAVAAAVSGFASIVPVAAQAPAGATEIPYSGEITAATATEAPPDSARPVDGTTESAAPAESDDASEPDLFLQTVAMDIASADYYALVAWARELGLSDAGSAQELRDRLYSQYGVEAPPPAASSSKTITIVSADKTEYLSAREDGESTVRFTGRVSISVKDDDSGETLTIAADQVVVNRDANILSARGDIIFERKKADGSDFFLGEALELDMDDWSGVFLDGESKRGSGATTDDALFFRADDILKRGTDVLVFKDGVVSSCDDENPHYSIRASKIWILGGNEWAMLNATLSVGELPVLYLPFFYYPGEEITFHPVFGYDERFGRYVQTTTYLLGEKAPKEQEISLLKIASGASGLERKVDGVFLRTTRDKKKDATSDFIKVIVDLYSTLGGFAAAQAQVASWGPFKSIAGFAGIGLTRSAFTADDGSYTPFVAAGDYGSVWNEVDFFGNNLPFRFGWELASSIDLGPVKVSFAAPFYSDSAFNRDFKDRTEDMNWLQFLDQETDETTIAKISSFTDTISLSTSLPAELLPFWLSSISLSKLSSSLSWNSILKKTPDDADEKILFAVDPAREFFAPYEWTMVDAGASVSGTLFKYPRTAQVRTAAEDTVAGTAGDAAETGEAEVAGPPDALTAALQAIPELSVPWSDVEKPEGDSAEGAPGFMPPSLASPETVSARTPFAASLGWSWSPTFSWKRRFLTSAWKEPQDIDWTSLYETRTVRNAGTLTLTSAVLDGFVGLSAGLTASTQYQDRPDFSDDLEYVSTSLRATWAKQDAQYRNDKVAATLKLTSSPFQDVWLFSPTSLSYSLSSKLYEYAFEAMDVADPSDAGKATYTKTWSDWTDDTISAHALSLDLGLKPWGYAQNLTIAADLPPLLQGYSGRLSLKSPWATLNVGTAYSIPKEDAEFEWDPLSTSLTVGTTPWPTLTGSFIWNIESSVPTSTSASVAWNGFSASLSAKEAVAYQLVSGSGWVSTGTAEFRMSAAAATFATSWKPPAAWQQRIAWTLDVNANAQQSFLRFTDSYLNFIFGLTFKVHEFLDITFASTSRNSSLWRYYPGLFDIPDVMESAREAVNPFEDLVKSFDFFDPVQENRKESLFKLKSLSITATHYLHDWDLATTFSASPVLEDLEYVFKTNFSITLSWRSVSQIKSTYKREGETVTWD